MSSSRVSSLNHTLDKSYEWLSDIHHELPWLSNDHAFTALKATLRALRDRLTPEEAVQLSSQLPALLRGYYFEGWKISQVPSHDKNIKEILERFEKYLGQAKIENPSLLFKTCLKVIGKRVSPGEIKDIHDSMPKNSR
jgi:uncharacterized protein (DUF2267 family)